MGRRTLDRIVENPSARAERSSRITLSDEITEEDPVPKTEEQNDGSVPGSAPARAEPQTLYARTLAPGQRCEVRIAGPGGGETLLLATDEVLLEAPNWTLDGSALILNGSGVLWRLDLQSGTLGHVPLSGVPELNNDHVLAPDGRSIYLSANDGHIYRADLSGGPGTRVTADDGMLHYLHGVRPDGRQLAYVGIPARDPSVPGRLFVAPADGPGPAREIATGKGHVDGPEYSPDGQWIYLNTEAFTTTIGHAQIGRLRADGDGLEQLVRSDTVDWFPHLSPDGEFAAYLRFPAGTQGHPADLAVEIVLVATSAWTTPLRTYGLPGGQGTINVNSWAPDSRRFAFVSYPAG